MTWTDSARAEYIARGYAIVPDVLSTPQIEAVNAEALALLRGCRGAIEGVVPAAPDESDADVLRRYACVHFPHKLSPVLRGVAVAPRVVDALTSVIGPNVKMMQSMYFVKSEGKPGQAWHQDEIFIPTRDRSLTGVWIALDDATTSNGCLWVIPGSHHDGILYPDREHEDPRFDCSIEAFDFPWKDADAVPVEIPAGTAIVFNGYLLHRSLPNTLAHGTRRAYVTHYMSANSVLPWAPPGEGEWMGKADLRDITVVAGRDPYARKGTVDVHTPHVRPERDGGCVR